MLKNQKQSHNLPLQSYKIDNSHLQTKINELEQLKSELRSTLSRSKQDQGALLNEINELKKENSILKNQIVKLEFTKKSQATLIEQLEKNLEQRQNSLYDCQMQLQQERTKRLQASKQFEHKLRQIKADKEEIVNHYEQQLLKISKVIEVNDTNQLKQIVNKANYNQEIQSPKILPRESIKVKKIKKASVQSIPSISNSGIKEKYWMSNSIPEKQEDSSLNSEDIYLEMIRFVYKQLTKIQIKSKDIHKIPIIGSFSQLRFPTSNDVHRFFSNYPFEIMDKQKVNLIHEFIVKQIQRKGYQTTGKEIIKQITNSLQEIECEKEMSLASGNSSATYLNDSSLSVGIRNEGPRRISKPKVMAALEYVGMSKGTIQQESSMQSGDSQLV